MSEYDKYLEYYNKVVSNKLKTYGVYELIDLWNKTKDTRFRKLASDIIKEIYLDLYNITNKNYFDYMRNAKYSNQYYSERTQNQLGMLSKLTLDFDMNLKYQELWYLMNKLEIK